jgi:Xaa-Pro aminopeptidase
MNLHAIQEALREEGLDGWLFYDFRKSNPFAYQILGLDRESMYTRRWFYFVPVEGEPTALVSAVEPHCLLGLPGKRLIFLTWRNIQEHLESLLTPGKRIAMEYSPDNAIPYISRVDAGTIELVRSFGVEVLSSGDISQHFMAVLTQQQIEGHRQSARALIEAKDQLFAELEQELRAGAELTEYRVQQRFAELIQARGQVLQEFPHIAVNANASNPHYDPNKQNSFPIKRGDLILLDFWAHQPGADAVWADFTWMAFAGSEAEIPAQQVAVFEVVREARDTAIELIRSRISVGERISGAEVDDAARDVITQAGYGAYFVHRTGHNIGISLHGDGAHNDNFETQDVRTLLHHTCCSIEPGIYLPEFGIRSEVDLLILERAIEVTGVPAQQRITPLLQG